MVTRMTKKDAVVGEIRRRVEEGELHRGDWIRQDVLADEMRTSITPVREALRELEAEGLLVGHPHRGVQVATIDLEQVKGVYMCRRLVEPYAMQRAAYAVSRRDVDGARQLNRAIAEASAAGDGLRASELNRELHFVFYDKSGPDSFVAFISDLWASFPWDMLRLLEDRASDSIAEHDVLIDAVQDNDADAIRLATEHHIMNGFGELAELLVSRDGGDGAGPGDDPFSLHAAPTHHPPSSTAPPQESHG